MMKLKVIISGGGTGGHIFPALSIAGELKRRNPDCDILFVGATGRMEMEKVPAAGFRIVGLPIIGMPRKPGLQSLKFIMRLFQSMLKARKLVREFKPDLAIGVGGYASGPLLRAAISAGVPALIQEQNSYAGVTNKLLARKASRICVAYDGMERFFPSEKISLTGNPVRQTLLDMNVTPSDARIAFGIPANAKVVLITGGSLGARSINNAILNNIENIRNSEAYFIWQTGSFYYIEMSEKVGATQPQNLQIHQFLNQMEVAYAASDVVISRAGAGTISELCLAGKPTILVPSPNVAEDHQTKNAQALVEKDAAILVRDHEINDKLFSETETLLKNNSLRNSMSENIRALARPFATQTIVDEALKIIRE